MDLQLLLIKIVIWFVCVCAIYIAINAIVDEIRTKITTYIEKIDEKRNQMNDEAKGADAINGYLSSHFGQIQLVQLESHP